MSRPRPDPLAVRGAIGLAVGLAAIGTVFLVRPRLGARVFGLPIRSAETRPYVQALAFRDLALAAALTLTARRRRALASLTPSLAAIPLADAARVGGLRGRGAAPSIALHLTSAAALIVLAAVSRRR